MPNRVCHVILLRLGEAPLPIPEFIGELDLPRPHLQYSILRTPQPVGAAPRVENLISPESDARHASRRSLNSPQPGSAENKPPTPIAKSNPCRRRAILASSSKCLPHSAVPARYRQPCRSLKTEYCLVSSRRLFTPVGGRGLKPGRRRRLGSDGRQKVNSLISKDKLGSSVQKCVSCLTPPRCTTLHSPAQFCLVAPECGFRRKHSAFSWTSARDRRFIGVHRRSSAAKLVFLERHRQPFRPPREKSRPLTADS
jgi:hypothetical protein